MVVMVEAKPRPVFIKATESAATGPAIPSTPESYAASIALSHSPKNTRELMLMFAPGTLAEWVNHQERTKSILVLKAGRDAKVFDVMTFIYGEPTSHRTISQETWLEQLMVVEKSFKLYREEGVPLDAMFAKANTSDQERGIIYIEDKPTRVKVCQTVHKPHIHITGLTKKEFQRIDSGSLSENDLRYVDRRFLPEFNEHVKTLAKKLGLRISGVHETNKIPKISIKTESERKALKSLYDEIYDLWSQVSLAITALDEDDVKQGRLFSEEGLRQLKAEGKLGNDGRPRFLNPQEAIPLMEKVINQFELKEESPKLTKTLRAIAQGNLGLKPDEVLRFGPNFGIIFTPTEDGSLEASFIPTFFEGKGPDPAIGILTWDERRALEAAETKEIAIFSAKLINSLRDKIKRLFPAPWSAIKYAREFGTFENLSHEEISLMISEWARRLYTKFTQPGFRDSEEFINARSLYLTLHLESAGPPSPYHDECLLEFDQVLNSLVKGGPLGLKISAFGGNAEEVRCQVSFDEKLMGTVKLETKGLKLDGNLSELSNENLLALIETLRPVNEFIWAHHRAVVISQNEANAIKDPAQRPKALKEISAQQRFRATGY
jgi:hypothetical protein